MADSVFAHVQYRQTQTTFAQREQDAKQVLLSGLLGWMTAACARLSSCAAPMQVPISPEGPPAVVREGVAAA